MEGRSWHGDAYCHRRAGGWPGVVSTGGGLNLTRAVKTAEVETFGKKSNVWNCREVQEPGLRTGPRLVTPLPGDVLREDGAREGRGSPFPRLPLPPVPLVPTGPRGTPG